jgi:LysM repeat protein
MTISRFFFPLFALGLSPVLAQAQGAPAKTTDTHACFELSYTKDPGPTLSALIAASSPLSKAAPFLGRPKGEDATLCYGPFANESEAAVAAVSLMSTQPLFEKGAVLDGFYLAAPLGPLASKGETKLGAPAPFSPTSAALVGALQDAKVSAKLGTVANSKAYAFNNSDARLPSKEEALAELTKNQSVLSIGQERVCEPSTGCLYWEKVLVGERNALAYLPAGNVFFASDAIAAPLGGWSLLVRPRAVLPFAPVSYQQNPDGKGAAESTVVLSLWAKGDGQQNPEVLGTVEVPGSSAAELQIAFSAEGVSLQRASDAKTLKVVSVDARRFPTTERSTALASTSAGTPEAAPGAAKSTKAPAKKPARVHKVRSGDTLWDLSQKYDVPVDSIRRANGLSKKATLQLGQKLIIPNSK